MIITPHVIYTLKLDEDELSLMIQNKYPALSDFLISHDDFLIKEILQYPYIIILKNLIKNKFLKLKKPKNLLILLGKLLPHNSAVVVLIINSLRYYHVNYCVRKWIKKTHKKMNSYLQNTSFHQFYKFIIENRNNFMCDIFMKISPQLEKKIIFFKNVKSNHEFYLNLLLNQEIISSEIARNSIDFIFVEKLENNIIILLEKILKQFNITDINLNIILHKINCLQSINIKTYFNIVNKKQKFIDPNYYHIFINQSKYWDDLSQILFWKLIIYQKIEFGIQISKNVYHGNDFLDDAFRILENIKN